MGLFKNARDAQSQAQEAMAAGQGTGGMGGVPGMGGDMTGAVAYAQLVQKLSQVGVEAPGVIHTIRPSGQTDMSGGQTVDFDVSIKPADGDPYQTTIQQSMLPAQMEGLSEGMSITAKYDPDSPTSAIIFSW